MVNAHALKDQLSRTNDEFRRLAEQHQELERDLAELAGRPYQSAAVQLEIATLKKRKLQIKDRMEDMLREHRQVTPGAAADAALRSPAARP
jgi:uncharacterized protein YdcH (DUF465 family)